MKKILIILVMFPFMFFNTLEVSALTKNINDGIEFNTTKTININENHVNSITIEKRGGQGYASVNGVTYTVNVKAYNNANQVGNTHTGQYRVENGIEIINTFDGIIQTSGLKVTHVTVDYSANDSGHPTITIGTAFRLIVDYDDLTPPIVPSGLTATDIEQTTAQLNWNANSESDLAGYNLYRDNIKVNTSLITTNSYTDYGLTSDTNYVYQVSAVDTSNNESARSGPLTVKTTAPQAQIPLAPTNFNAVSGDGLVKLTWQIVNDATNYNIYRDNILIQTQSARNYTDTDVINGVTYNYQVSAINSAGESEKSVSIQATPQKTVVIPPINLISTAQDTSVELEWDHIDESSVSGFNIYRDNVKINASLVTTKNYIDTGLTSETEYTYSVTAVDSNNNESDYSDPINVTTLKEIDTTPPATPIGLKATPYNAAVTLTWDANKEGDLAGYNVYVDGQKVNTSVIKNTKYTIKGLNNDQQYEFHITAVDTSDNESTTSNTVSAMPLASLQDPIDFEGLNFPFSVFDMLKITFSYIALFAPWILLGLAIFFSPEIAELIKKSVRKQKGRLK